MGASEDTVTDPSNTSGVANPAMSNGTGGSATGGMPRSETSDAGSDTVRLQEMLDKADRDRQRLQSTLDQNLARAQQTWATERQVLMEELDNVKTKDMDENARLKYDLEKERRQRAELTERYEQAQQAADNRTRMTQWATAYQEAFDVNPNDLDYTDPEAFSAKAWQQAADAYQALKQQLEEVKGGNLNLNPRSTQATRPGSDRSVVTGSGATPRTGLSWEDLRATVGRANNRDPRNVTDDEIFQAAERGQIDLNQFK